MTLQNLLSLIMFLVSEQALINWSETGGGIHKTAEETVPLGKAALHKWCRVVLLAAFAQG